MENYIYDIKMAALFFPFVALLVCVPFILLSYHKYGSISFFKTILTYSFILYIMCVYFLVILPLPSKEEVLKLTTPRLQLIPFTFIKDIINNIYFNISFIFTSYVYVPLFNIVLTIPFGIYLRYCFKCSFKKTILYSFLLSMFFEITQLSGLYGIYSRGYRLCDVDDLILNTIGGLLGYLLTKPIAKFLPTIDKVNEIAIKKGEEVSGFKRFTYIMLDIVLITFVYAILSSFIHFKYFFEIFILSYYIIMTLFFKGTTLAQKWLNLKVVDNNNKVNHCRIIFRYILFMLLYIIIPFCIIALLFTLYSVNNIYIDIIIFGICGIIFVVYVIISIKFIFTKKQMLYEKISKTKLISTIKDRNDN